MIAIAESWRRNERAGSSSSVIDTVSNRFPPRSKEMLRRGVHVTGRYLSAAGAASAAGADGAPMRR
ncbi:hypothetical protein BZM26_19870 [Paraburkholderia strydomiana]|nr:hypothetical protein BZM26_19870 [Paraburkholderia strydomiana]